MTTNIQSFAGDVEVHSGNLSVKSLEVKDPISKFGSNNATYSNVGLVLTAKEGSNVAFYYDQTNANVVLGYTNSEANDGDRMDVLTDGRANLMVYGNVYVTGSVHGDGSTLTGLVTTLQSVTEFGANTNQMVEFEHPTTGINVFSNVLVAGNVTAATFIGDGSQLDNIASNLEEIVNNGNVTSNTVQFTNATTAFITTSNIGIANSSPTADLCVGSNVVIDDDARDVVQVAGNVNCHGLFLQSVSILPGYGLDTVTGISNSTPNTISITNETLSLITSSMAGIGIVPDSTDVGLMLHVDGHLRLGGESTTDENEQMYIKSAGALGVLANDADTTNQDTKLILQTGGTSNSNITLEGNTEEQFMTFGVGATERMRIEQDGNVGINVTSASYTLDVGGDIRFDGNLYQGGGPFVATPWTITGDDIYYTVADGSVGIGTATTGAKFHTEGNVVINTTMSDSTSNGGVVIDGGIAVSGNVHTGNLYVVNNVHIQSVQVDATPDLGSVCAVAATTNVAVSITNTTASTSVGSGALTVDGGVGVDGNLYVGGNLAFPTPAVATTAGNVITWNSTTGLLEDSGGLLANKFAVVSEQPPSALTANSTTVTDHGVYKLTTSGLATDSNTWNAFNGDASYAWTSLSTYTGTDNVYGGSVQLSAVSSTGSGEWLAVEFPYKTTLRHMKLTPAAVASYPGTANLYATNDSTSWTLLKEWSDVVPGSESEVQTVVVDASEAYKKFAIVPTKAAGASTSVAIERWQLFAESFAVDGGKVAMASGAITGGNTVVDQTGPHARGPVPLRKYPEVALTYSLAEEILNAKSWIQSGYTVSSTSRFSSSFDILSAFNGNKTNDSHFASYSTAYSDTSPFGYTFATNNLQDTNSSQYSGEKLEIKFTKPIKVSTISVTRRSASASSQREPKTGYIFASNTGVNGEWVKLVDVTNLFTSADYSSYDPVGDLTRTINVNASAYYTHYVFLVTEISGDTQLLNIAELEYYGYEETSDPDTSVDTKITSQFNLPDTTGVKLYIDGDKGSTATDFSGEGHTLTENNATYDSAEKAWEFSSLSTSNVTMSSGDLAMEGTHPHSVSLWFNAANVTSNATLFHVGTAAGEGDAKTAISLTETGHLGWIDGGDNQFLSANTWHNLVYATQGGGGVRTCYLDGRKLGDAQVQDTFGEYPPFAMTTYSEYGYTVSASSDLDTTYHAWEAFDDDENDGWICDDYNSDGTTPRYTGGITSSGGGVYQGPISTGSIPISGSGSETIAGEYIQIEFPFKFKLEDIAYQREGAYWGYNRLPHSGSIVACNDGINWKTIHNWTGLTDADVGSTDGSNLAITQAPFRSGIFAVDKSGATYDAYKFFRIICTRIQKTDTSGDGNSYGLWSVWQLELYGHKENDTTRFPVSSTVLKYPHVAMTGPAQRGYVASASSVYAMTDGTNREAYKAFDESTNYNNPNRWICEDGKYNTSGAYTGSESHTDVDGNVENGEWLKIQLPRKVAVDHFNVRSYPTSGSQTLVNYAILGSNDDSTWYQVHKRTGSSSGTTDDTDITPSGTYSSSPYKIFLFIWHDKVADANQHVSLSELSIYGTEEDLDVVARVGEGLDGKVANFRVYDKYLHEEQALELWDAQKDQFGRAESSVVVHKGRLGVGTTEPEGRFAVLDEPGDMEEFPPRAMTAAETYMEGHGVFRASASYTAADSNSGPPAPWRVFSKDVESRTTGWLGSDDHNAVTGSNPGEYNGSNQLTSSTPSGEWLKIELPHRIKLNSYALKPWGQANRYGVADYPKSFYIYGSNDGSSWELVDSRVNTTDTPTILGASVASNETINYNVAQSGLAYYDKYAIVITKINSEAVYAVDNTVSATYVGIGEWRLFGTRERGQSTLHDGQLTLTKNLTVPRIGPALDADDTPRRDRLVVEYNTSTNPTANDTVKDTSGRGNDGLFYGGASYDATEKALVFDGTDDTIRGTQNIGTGEKILTMAMWIKRTAAVNTYDYVCTIGTSTTGQMAGFTINSNKFNFTKYGAQTISTTTINNGQWYHVVGVYKGGNWNTTNTEIYVDGVKETLTGGTTSALNLTGTQITFGDSTEYDGTADFNGSISNFKLYDVALTADEVKRLYDMGRLGNVIAQPVHIAAPLYAPGTIVQVEQAVKTDTSSTTSTSYVDISGLSVTIRPKFHNSKILVSYMVNAYSSNTHGFLTIKRTRGGSSTNIGEGEAGGNRVTCTTYINGLSNDGSMLECHSFEYLDDANGTESITYQLQMKVTSTSYSLYVNRSETDTNDAYHGRTSSSITVKEVCQ
jgi:hypothetical protein